MINKLILKWSLFFSIVLLASCANKNRNSITAINIGTHSNNELKIQIDVTTSDDVKMFVEYWSDELENKEKITTPVSNNGTSHSFVLCNIFPETNYNCQLVSIQNQVETKSKVYTFKSRELPPWLQKQFKANYFSENLLPNNFKKGFMLMSKRETPGVAYIIDYKGNLRWYHTVDGTGFKVSRFTEDRNIISILGKNDEPTSYGGEILEIDIMGDTITHLKKGQEDFKYTIHHEIIKNSENNIVTLYLDEKVMDLTSIGGKKNDTINGDGILIMNNKGKQLWKWSVFDVINPLKDKDILKNKKDWLHANSLNYDTDGNFIISFYNIGQIWKVDSHSGNVIWKLGKGGTIDMPKECNFSESHAVHINDQGNLMFFDNGVEKKQSSVFSFQMDEKNNTVTLNKHIKLPVDLYNSRMGSAYMIDDETVLVACSKRHITVLVNNKGIVLWTLDSNIPPYRVQFIPEDKLKPYLLN